MNGDQFEFIKKLAWQVLTPHFNKKRTSGFEMHLQ